MSAEGVRVVDGALVWTSGLAVDGDGAPACYAPANSGLPSMDYLANAGRPGHWWALACDSNGTPYIQGSSDPCPGYYVSMTALQDKRWPANSPRRYVDSNSVPYIVVPPDLIAMGVHIGDIGFVRCGKFSSPGIVADIGPAHHLGEGSIALARALGLPASPRHGGIGSGVDWVVFPNTASTPRWVRPVNDAIPVYASWGGDSKLTSSLS